ncbi:hypothetical protein VDGL01_12226 [Verticillium dahliae]
MKDFIEPPTQALQAPSLFTFWGTIHPLTRRFEPQNSKPADPKYEVKLSQLPPMLLSPPRSPPTDLRLRHLLLPPLLVLAAVPPPAAALPPLDLPHLPQNTPNSILQRRRRRDKEVVVLALLVPRPPSRPLIHPDERLRHVLQPRAQLLHLERRSAPPLSSMRVALVLPPPVLLVFAAVVSAAVLPSVTRPRLGRRVPVPSLPPVVPVLAIPVLVVPVLVVPIIAMSAPRPPSRHPPLVLRAHDLSENNPPQPFQRVAVHSRLALLAPLGPVLRGQVPLGRVLHALVREQEEEDLEFAAVLLLLLLLLATRLVAGVTPLGRLGRTLAVADYCLEQWKDRVHVSVVRADEAFLDLVQVVFLLLSSALVGEGHFGDELSREHSATS